MTKSALVLTHRWPKETACAFDPLRVAAQRAGVTLRFDADETWRAIEAAGGEALAIPTDVADHAQVELAVNHERRRVEVRGVQVRRVAIEALQVFPVFAGNGDRELRLGRDLLLGVLAHDLRTPLSIIATTA